MLVILDYSGNILYSSHFNFSEDFLKISPGEALNIYDFVGKSARQKLADRLIRIKEGLPMPPTEYKLINKNKAPAYIEVISKIATFNEQPAIFALIRDISVYHRREKQLITKIIHAEQSEHMRFARELHDELGPFLTGLKLYLEELDDPLVDRNRKSLLIEYLKKMSDEAVIKIRSVINNLMPKNLIELGLIPALEKIIERFTITGVIKITLNVNSYNLKTDSSLEFIIYRTVIELINNTIKHSGASEAVVVLSKSTLNIIVVYSDNGKGFDLKKCLSDNKGIGLATILDRVELVHGKYKFHSKPGKGIKFEFRFLIK